MEVFRGLLMVIGELVLVVCYSTGENAMSGCVTYLR